MNLQIFITANGIQVLRESNQKRTKNAQMIKPTITVTTTEAIYYLTVDEFMTATENGSLDRLDAEEIVSVQEDLKFDWRKIGF